MGVEVDEGGQVGGEGRSVPEVEVSVLTGGEVVLRQVGTDDDKPTTKARFSMRARRRRKTRGVRDDVPGQQHLVITTVHLRVPRSETLLEPIREKLGRDRRTLIEPHPRALGPKVADERIQERRSRQGRPGFARAPVLVEQESDGQVRVGGECKVKGGDLEGEVRRNVVRRSWGGDGLGEI